MDSKKDTPRPSVVGAFFQKTWAVMPVLIAIYWIGTSRFGMISSVIMTTADVLSIYVLGRYYREQIGAMQWKRILLLLIEVPICATLFFLGLGYAGRQEALANFYLVKCPPALFLINIFIYIKNSRDPKMFAALLFTDPLLHWMSLYVFYVIGNI